MTTLVLDGQSFEFESEDPVPTIKAYGKVWTIGWDIPTYWAIDNSNQCWMSDGHGSFIRKVPEQQLLNEAFDSPDVEVKIREALGRKPRRPSWIDEAKTLGWTPPEGWDESIYDIR